MGESSIWKGYPPAIRNESHKGEYRLDKKQQDEKKEGELLENYPMKSLN